MDLQKFDSTIKSALENIEVPFDPGAWAALESRLNHLPAADAVDKALRPTLERIDTAYDSGSWSALSTRMDSLARIRRLRMVKLSEAVIFLLLLLNLKGFFGIVESVTNPVPVKKEFPGPIANGSRSKGKKPFSAAEITIPKNDPQAGLSLAAQVAELVQNIAASLTKSIDNQGAILPANTPQPIVSDASLLDPARFYGQSGIIQFPVGNALPVPPVEPLIYADNFIAIPGIPLIKTYKSSGFYLASFASFDKNQVRESGYTDRKNGYGVGVALGYRKGKWGMETGITYSNKHYQPKRVNKEYQDDPNVGISIFYIDNVDASMCSIPFKVTRRIAKMGNTSAHAVAGVSANFAVSKDYGYKTVHYPPPQPSGNTDPVTPYILPLPDGKGLLENGGLAYNAFATADLGLRVERTFGKHCAVFVEPVYRQSLGGGLGPNYARLSTFSVQAGVLASL